MSKPIIKPSIGRVVLYRPNPNDSIDQAFVSREQKLSAMISYVWHNELVNLAVNDADGNSFSKTSVPLFQGDADDCPPGSCCWMPYQKAQAAKEES